MIFLPTHHDEDIFHNAYASVFVLVLAVETEINTGFRNGRYLLVCVS